jgi:hypothetical protein
MSWQEFKRSLPLYCIVVAWIAGPFVALGLMSLLFRGSVIVLAGAFLLGGLSVFCSWQVTRNREAGVAFGLAWLGVWFCVVVIAIIAGLSFAFAE